MPPPTLIAPADGSAVPTTTETLQWSSVNGAVEYLLHWRQVDEEGYYFAWVSNTQHTTWFSANTTYEWWVSARNDYAIGTDSETWQFTRPAGSSLSSQGLNSSIMIENQETSITLEERDSK